MSKTKQRPRSAIVLPYRSYRDASLAKAAQKPLRLGQPSATGKTPAKLEHWSAPRVGLVVGAVRSECIVSFQETLIPGLRCFACCVRSLGRIELVFPRIASRVRQGTSQWPKGRASASQNVPIIPGPRGGSLRRCPNCVASFTGNRYHTVNQYEGRLLRSVKVS